MRFVLGIDEYLHNHCTINSEYNAFRTRVPDIAEILDILTLVDRKATTARNSRLQVEYLLQHVYDADPHGFCLCGL